MDRPPPEGGASVGSAGDGELGIAARSANNVAGLICHSCDRLLHSYLQPFLAQVMLCELLTQ